MEDTYRKIIEDLKITTENAYFASNFQYRESELTDAMQNLLELCTEYLQETENE